MVSGELLKISFNLKLLYQATPPPPLSEVYALSIRGAISHSLRRNSSFVTRFENSDKRGNEYKRNQMKSCGHLCMYIIKIKKIKINKIWRKHRGGSPPVRLKKRSPGSAGILSRWNPGSIMPIVSPLEDFQKLPIASVFHETMAGYW